jgi:Histidine kinase
MSKPARAFWALLRQAGVASLRQWRWHDTALSLALGTMCLVYMGGPLSPALMNQSWLAPLAYNIMQFGFPLVLALRVGDRLVVQGLAPWKVYSTAVVGVVTVGVWVIGPLLMPLLGSDPQWTVANDVWLMAGIGVVYALGVAGYARWRASQALQARLRAAEAQRARQHQQLQLQRLLALQARVEPQLLFDTLARVQALIDSHTAEAAQLLEDLIALLRGLLPAPGATATTLGRELQLVQAYGRVLRAPGLLAPLLQLDLQGASAEAVMAPQLLPPLLRELATHGDCAWQLQAHLLPSQRLHITLTPQHLSEALRSLDLASWQQRWRSVHGETVTLTRHDAPPQLEIAMDQAHDARADR